MRKNLRPIVLVLALILTVIMRAANVAGHRVIYELNVGMFTTEGTFKAAQAKLDDLKATGVDVVWLMPIYPRGSSKSPYAVMDFETTNTSYGTVDDLKAFVSAAHEKDMLVILDWVPNQTANEHPWRSAHPKWYNGKHTYSDISDLDYDNAEMKAEMTRIMKSWIDRCDIDGFRFDFLINTRPSYWLSANAELKEYASSKGKSELILLAEIDTNDGDQNQRFSNKTYNIGFTHDYAWWLQETVLKNDFGKNGNVAALKTNLQKFVADSKTLGLNRMVYLTNHDQNWNDGGATLQDMYGDNRYALTVLEFTLYGMPLLYNGQEIGGGQKLDYFNDTKITWSNPDTKMQNLVKQLAEIKHTIPALHETADVTFLDTEDANVLAYQRIKDDSKLTVVLNFGNSQVTVSVEGNPYTVEAHGYKWTTEGNTMTGIHTIAVEGIRQTDDSRIFTINGMEVTNTYRLPRGIYIRGGRKFIVKQ